jgi:4-amino-4-deoxychorismate lyase
MVLVNGEFTDQIATADRGLQYGDGLFETIAVTDGKLHFWLEHYERLQTGCRRLRLPVPDADILRREADEICRGSERAIIKIIVTSGIGGRGYRRPEKSCPTRILSLHPFPEYPTCYQTEGVALRFCTTPLSQNPVLAGIKHLNRLEQVLARSEWQDAAVPEGLMLNCEGHVIEGTMTNLFYGKESTLYTAPIVNAGIEGVMRRIIIDWWAEEGRVVTQHFFRPETLLNADEVFVCNSVIGVWPVTRIEQQFFAIGPLSRQIQQQVRFFYSLNS